MKLYKYKSYDEYVKAQVDTNKKKIDRVFMEESVANLVANYVKTNIPLPKFGICHGVRNAWEVYKFRELLNFEIIGTEISPSADKFRHTIQWDFHEVKPEWVGAVDFIYSNSLDHSYDPHTCLKKWISCLSPDGRCFIEWSLMSTEKPSIESMKADCFGATLEEYRTVLLKDYVVKELPIQLKTKWIEDRGMKDDRIIFVISGGN